MSPPSGKQIIDEACAEFGYSRAALLRPSQRGGQGARDRRALARDATMYRLRERGLSYPRIANLMGLKDHTSAIAAVRRHAEENGLDVPPNMNCLPWSKEELRRLSEHLDAPRPLLAEAFPNRGLHAALCQRSVLKKALGLTLPYGQVAEASA